MKKVTAVFLIIFMLANVTGVCAQSMVHPGGLNTQSDLERISEMVENEEEPFLSAYKALVLNSYAQIGNSRATETIVRGGSGQNFAQLYQDTHRAYLCAIRWKITGDTQYADCARDILNAWSKTLKTVTGNADRYLAAGIYGYQLAAAAEIMRDYDGFEKEQMQTMLLEVFYKPLIERFLYSNDYGNDHNDAHIMNYWANWDLCNMAAAMAIGVFCDDEEIYNKAVDYYKNGAGNGSVYNAIPKVYEKGALGVPVGQWQEAGRDMEHTQLGVGLMAVICEIAWNQGDDLYGYADNRFMHGAEYVAEHLLGYNVPFTEYNWYQGKGNWSVQSAISPKSGIRPIWTMIYNHYVNRKGYNLPGVSELVRKNGIENGAGGHASTFDQFGFGTLLYTDAGLNTTANVQKSSVPEGVYRIVNRKSDKALADADGSVLQFTVNETDTTQLWEICYVDSGVYVITNVGTGKTLSIENGSYANAADIKTIRYEGGLSQKFSLTTGNNEYYENFYKIAPYHSGLGFDVINARVEDGVKVIQYTYNSGHHQQWSLELVEEKDTDVPEADNKVQVELNGKCINFVAVYNPEGILERVKICRESVCEIECNLSLGEYVEVFTWNENLTPVK